MLKYEQICHANLTYKIVLDYIWLKDFRTLSSVEHYISKLLNLIWNLCWDLYCTLIERYSLLLWFWVRTLYGVNISLLEIYINCLGFCFDYQKLLVVGTCMLTWFNIRRLCWTNFRILFNWDWHLIFYIWLIISHQNLFEYSILPNLCSALNLNWSF